MGKYDKNYQWSKDFKLFGNTYLDITLYTLTDYIFDVSICLRKEKYALKFSFEIILFSKAFYMVIYDYRDEPKGF